MPVPHLLRPPRLFLLPAMVALALAAVAPHSALAAPENLRTWKRVEGGALLRIDDRPVPLWNVYETDDKEGPVILQLGNRFLLIDARERRVFELPPEQLTRRENEIAWDPARQPERPLPTSQWLARNVGSAYRIRVRLDAEGRVIDLQLPRRPDFRSLY